jgi:gliding motility-associated lipoprotein GldH
MGMRIKHKFLGCLLLLVLIGCGEAPFYNKIYSFKEGKWEQTVKPSFTLMVKDINKTYSFTVTIRTTTDYKYSNLWMFMNTVTPDGVKSREPFKMEMTYDDGKWIGKKTGTIVEHVLHFKQRKLPTKGKYTFIIEQGVTQSEIDQILDISFTTEVSK